MSALIFSKLPTLEKMPGVLNGRCLGSVPEGLTNTVWYLLQGRKIDADSRYSSRADYHARMKVNIEVFHFRD
jgi:hypothetical protein